MFSVTLRHPDLPQHRSEPGYSPAVAKKLIAALDDLRRPTSRLPTRLRRPLSHLENIEYARMSLRQRLRTFYALGKTWRGLGDDLSGIAYIDRALDVAEHLEDRLAAVDLLYLAGAAERARSQYGAGAYFLSTGLDILKEVRERGGDGMREDTEQELAMYVLLAGCLYAQEDYTGALSLLDETSRLVPQTDDPVFHAATGRLGSGPKCSARWAILLSPCRSPGVRPMSTPQPAR